MSEIPMWPYECRHGNHEDDCPTCGRERLEDRLRKAETEADEQRCAAETVQCSLDAERRRAEKAESRVAVTEASLRAIAAEKGRDLNDEAYRIAIQALAPTASVCTANSTLEAQSKTAELAAIPGADPPRCDATHFGRQCIHVAGHPSHHDFVPRPSDAPPTPGHTCDPEGEPVYDLRCMGCVAMKKAEAQVACFECGWAYNHKAGCSKSQPPKTAHRPHAFRGVFTCEFCGEPRAHASHEQRTNDAPAPADASTTDTHTEMCDCGAKPGYLCSPSCKREFGEHDRLKKDVSNLKAQGRRRGAALRE